MGSLEKKYTLSNAFSTGIIYIKGVGLDESVFGEVNLRIHNSFLLLAAPFSSDN